MTGRKVYRQELNKRKEQLQDAIAKAQAELSDKRMDNQWFEDYRKLNHLRVGLMTVKNRIEHLERRCKYSGIETVYINN